MIAYRLWAIINQYISLKLTSVQSTCEQIKVFIIPVLTFIAHVHPLHFSCSVRQVNHTNLITYSPIFVFSLGKPFKTSLTIPPDSESSGPWSEFTQSSTWATTQRYLRVLQVLRSLITGRKPLGNLQMPQICLQWTHAPLLLNNWQPVIFTFILTITEE